MLLEHRVKATVKHAPVPAISDEDLLATVPQVSKYATVEVKNVSNVPSDYMDPVRWTVLTRDVTKTHTSSVETPESDLFLGGAVIK